MEQHVKSIDEQSTRARQYRLPIRCHAKSDFGNIFMLQDAVEALDDGILKHEIEDINDALERYNIYKLLHLSIWLPDHTPEQHSMYQLMVDPIRGNVSKYIISLGKKSFVDVLKSVDHLFQDDLWECISEYGLYQKIDFLDTAVMAYLCADERLLLSILRQKKLVKVYDEKLADMMRSSDAAAGILIRTFLIESDDKLHMPKSLSFSERTEILHKFVKDGRGTLPALQAIFSARSTPECPIPRKLRWAAQQCYSRLWGNDDQMVKFRMSYSVGCKQQDAASYTTHKDNTLTAVYDTVWLKESLDPPSILNNFVFLLGLVDSRCRFTMAAVKSWISAMERCFSPRVVRAYEGGMAFKIQEDFTTLQTSFYSSFLKNEGISLEPVFEWFFNTYLPGEFGVNGFTWPPYHKASTLVDRCSTLARELERVLRYYEMYVEDGSINQDVYELSEQALEIDAIPSLIYQKYLYTNSQMIQHEMEILFDDQSCLSCKKASRGSYSTSVQLFSGEALHKTDFEDYNHRTIDWLVTRGTLVATDDGELRLNERRVAILSDIYEHDVTCAYGLHSDVSMVNELIESGDLKAASTLFSAPEAKYLNYMLKSKYSDGLELRNRYAHGTYPHDERAQLLDYVRLLKLMVLVIIKINDELVWVERAKKRASSFFFAMGSMLHWAMTLLMWECEKRCSFYVVYMVARFCESVIKTF